MKKFFSFLAGLFVGLLLGILGTSLFTIMAMKP
jgi:hypothetical protein